MLQHLAQVQDRDLAGDVCVVGGGPAGISVAHRLAAKGAGVILAEAGGLEYDDRSQDCYRGQVIGDEYYDLGDARLRYLGGTSGHWTGVCAYLEPFDFEEKGNLESTEWPISYGDLGAYFEEARNILQAPAPRPNRKILDERFHRIDVPTSSGPVRFGEQYLHFLQSATSVLAILHANLIGVDHQGGQITAAKFKDYEGNLVRVRARHYVLACGGIENARLLLHINQQLGENFGNSSNALGKYFTEHVHGDIGDVVVTDSDMLLAGSPTDDSGGVSGHYTPTEKFIRENNILNFRLKLHYPADTSAIKRLVRDIVCVAPNLAKRLANAAGHGFQCFGRMGSVLEQAPLAENRIELGDEVDRFGMRRPKLFWRRSDIDRRTTREVALGFARAIAELDVGRMKISDWVLRDDLPVESDEWLAAYHHIGTTRMGATADTGVVDKNCRVYGTANLFVAGSSVFPSCGHANPTLPIVAASLRLADHILGTDNRG